MSIIPISTGRKYQPATSTSNFKVSNAPAYVAQTFAQNSTPIECCEQDSIQVYVSDAEAKVIASKAKKAGLSLNEYMRHAALGFPIT